jgi:hypothetical protein
MPCHAAQLDRLSRQGVGHEHGFAVDTRHAASVVREIDDCGLLRSRRQPLHAPGAGLTGQASRNSRKCARSVPAEPGAHQIAFAIVLLGIQPAPQEFEAQVDQVRVDDVRLAVVADVEDATFEELHPTRPRPTCRACLAGRAASPCC